MAPTDSLHRAHGWGLRTCHSIEQGLWGLWVRWRLQTGVQAALPTAGRATLTLNNLFHMWAECRIQRSLGTKAVASLFRQIPVKDRQL